VTNARLIAGLARAVESSPDDASLRLHLAELLLATGQPFESVQHVAAVLATEPSCAHAQILMTEALAQIAPATPGAQGEPSEPHETHAEALDWADAVEELEDVVPTAFADLADATPDSPYDVEESWLRLTDVAGMTEVKKRLEAGFLAPMRNPELRRVYGKSLRGGLLLYGPPGCGKTFLARALAGEMAARFLAVSLPDVLDAQAGQSERNLTDIFDRARRNAPCVLFLDEIDALGNERSNLRNSGLRATVNRLLTEMDGVGKANDGVFVLGATSHPWDVDEALTRPGRLDRTLLVLPPDQPAREAIFRRCLSTRSVDEIDVEKLAEATRGLSGTDIARICESAAALALEDSAASGSARMIDMADLDAARSSLQPSLLPWFERARKVALVANGDGRYDDVLTYMRRRRML
jgi:SpoVK/Ycf46/Vps4 family AAA+-type ATPase